VHAEKPQMNRYRVKMWLIK